MNYPKYFYLDKNYDFVVDDKTYHDEFVYRWSVLEHTLDKRISLILRYGEVFKMNNPIQIVKDSKLFIRYATGLQKISEDGLEIEVFFLPNNNEEQLLFSIPVKNYSTNQYYNEILFSLDNFSDENNIGKFKVSINAGKYNDSRADWLALADFVVAPSQDLNRIKTLSHKKQRTLNEGQHFNIRDDLDYYKITSNNTDNDFVDYDLKIKEKQKYKKIIQINKLDPHLNETAYDYSRRLLLNFFSTPNYYERLKKNRKKIQILSLCTGNGRIESKLAENLSNIEWTISDINPKLLNDAILNFPKESGKIKKIVFDINNINNFEFEKYDIIICCSALHHLCNLEEVFQFISHSLKTDGEFWSIGEAIGRNGNRLLQQDYNFANEIFLNLPSKFRLNKWTNTIDTKLPNNDLSGQTFEGIRSEEILNYIHQYFIPIEELTFNCFLWRLLDLTYLDNYDLKKKNDIDLVKLIVEKEINYFSKTYSATELHGIYKNKYFFDQY